jgi:aralkylamine N-acetyltransferase
MLSARSQRVFTMTIHDDNSVISWHDAAGLFASVGWQPRAPAELQAAFSRSVATAFAMRGAQLVGLARATGDGIYYATVVDVVVHPKFQNQGIGSELVRFLQEKLKNCLLVTLTANPELQAFYRRLGWLPQTTAMILPRSPQQAALNCPPTEVARRSISQTRRSIPMG